MFYELTIIIGIYKKYEIKWKSQNNTHENCKILERLGKDLYVVTYQYQQSFHRNLDIVGLYVNLHYKVLMNSMSFITIMKDRKRLECMWAAVFQTLLESKSTTSTCTKSYTLLIDESGLRV